MTRRQVLWVVVPLILILGVARIVLYREAVNGCTASAMEKSQGGHWKVTRVSTLFSDECAAQRVGPAN